MSVFSRKQINIDPDDHELIKLIAKQKKTDSKTKTTTTETDKSTAPKGTHSRSTKAEYRPRRMSDSFTLGNLERIENSGNHTKEVSLDEYLSNDVVVDEVVQVEPERPLDMPFHFTKVKAPSVQQSQIEPMDASDITSQFNQEELMDYMKKSHRVNRLMVTIIVTIIVIVAIVAIIILLLNLRKSGQSSPLGGM